MSRARVILTSIRWWLPVLGVVANPASFVVVMVYGLKEPAYLWWAWSAFVAPMFYVTRGRSGTIRSDFVFPALSVLALLIACFGQR